jgi:hypothetical protein
MTTQEIQQALSKFAESDMKLARKEQEISIVETKLGCVELGYDKANKEYTLSKRVFPEIKIIAKGKKSEVKEALINTYSVEIEAA